MEVVSMLSVILLAVVFHEFGHFIALKKYGITPPEFSVGFDPKLFGFHYKGTEFMICSIPLGGYVKSSDVLESGLTKRQKINVFLAGPWANVFTAIPFGLVCVFHMDDFADFHWFVLMCLVVIGTPILFVVAIPLTLYVILDGLFDPASFIKGSQGIIGMMAEGTTVKGLSPMLNFALNMYGVSISLASFNLLPLSILDGGRIFETLFERHKRFVLAWSVSSAVLLIAVVLLVNVGDILQLIGFF